jgi:malate synthase
LVREVLDEEMDRIRAAGDASGHLQTARDVFEQVALADEYADFLTLPAYEKAQ